MKNTTAHRHYMNPLGQSLYPDGQVPWGDAIAPNLTGNPDERGAGVLRHCSYCGSMHPADVAEAIRAGATGEWADRKYSWPHKAYFHGIPNPHAGMLESRSSRTWGPSAEEAGQWRMVQRPYKSITGEPVYMWAEVGRPADATTNGKFYTVHLQDATPEDRETIESHLGMTFEFTDEGKKVGWKHYSEPTP